MQEERNGNKEQFPIQDQLRQFLIYADVFPGFNWRLTDQIVERLVPLTEENNRNFARDSPTELSFLISSVPLTEGNNRNFARGSPTDIHFSFVFDFFG